jgi:hypothetical protein
MELKEIIKSRLYIVIILSLAAIVVLILTFGAGMYVGFHKARFSYQWGENYHKNFGGPRGGLFRDFGGKDLIDANGVAGQIMKIDGSTLVIKGRDNVEKIVVVKNDATIKRLNEILKLNDLKIDDLIVVIGEPNNNGQIEAKFLRIMP